VFATELKSLQRQRTSLMTRVTRLDNAITMLKQVKKALNGGGTTGFHYKAGAHWTKRASPQKLALWRTNIKRGAIKAARNRSQPNENTAA
jgi:hypothetical protein